MSEYETFSHRLSSIAFLWAILILIFVAKYVRSYLRLRHIPGPKSYALTDICLAANAWNARSVHTIWKLHQSYGPVVRIGSNQVSFNSIAALRAIYGAGNNFERTNFYRMFDAYGKPNLFTFGSNQQHRERKKLVSHMYANQNITSNNCADMIQRKVTAFLKLIETEPSLASETFTSLHYFSFDAISEFVYGDGIGHGATNALGGNQQHRHLIDDILDPKRRRLAWFTVHLPSYTKFITTRTGFMERVVNILGLVPMSKPFTYSGIRQHALRSFYAYKNDFLQNGKHMPQTSVLGRLHHVREQSSLDDMDIASEAADHLLAGIDTTSDSLMFIFWALSLPQHRGIQEQLRLELSSQDFGSDDSGDIKALNRLPLLNAIIKESLRLYSPLPTFEPRVSPVDNIVDNVLVPAGTVVGMSPYCLHRAEAVFPESERWNPRRWLTAENKLLPEDHPQNRWFWAFSSGPRMCIGIHLAMAEMVMLTAAVYRSYSTKAKFPDVAPAITSRYEIFSDDTFHRHKEHECEIIFERIGGS